MRQTLRWIIISVLVLMIGCLAPSWHTQSVSFGLPAPASTPASNQLVRCDELVTETNGGGVFTWASGAQTCSNATAIITRATFISWIKNSGSCASGSNSATYVMTYQDMLNCRTLYTSHSTSLSGTATGYVPCSQTCQSNGGSPTLAVPYAVTFTVGIVNTTYPVSYNFTVTGSTSTGWTIKDAASTPVTQASGTSTGTFTGNITTGTTGTWAFNLGESTSFVNSSVSGTITSYY